MSISIDCLSMERQFRVAELCSKVDKIEDLEDLKAYTKGVIKIAALAGYAQDELNEAVMKLQESEKEMLDSIRYLEEVIGELAKKIST